MDRTLGCVSFREKRGAETKTPPDRSGGVFIGF